MNSNLKNEFQSPHKQQWDATLYDAKHFFVSQLAADLVELLAPQNKERILDLGCGTGYLTHKISISGSEVMGIDSAPSMINQARENYNNLNFEVADGTNLQFTEEFDAVFSNAVLHWIKEPQKVIASIYRALKPGGRFVAEFGGKGNIKSILTAVNNAIGDANYSIDIPWYFPSISEYGTLLEEQGLELTFATLFERLTPLEDGERGMQNWLKMFGSFLDAFPTETQNSMLVNIENQLRPILYKNGNWFVDYRRIRVVAIKK